MPDGLFTRRPSLPPPLDLEAIVAARIAYVDPDSGQSDLPVPATWSIEPGDDAWPILKIEGQCWNADGEREPWTVRHRIPRLRALPHEVEKHVELALLAVVRLIEEKRRVGYTFEDAPVAAPAPAAVKRQRRARA